MPQKQPINTFTTGSILKFNQALLSGTKIVFIFVVIWKIVLYLHSLNGGLAQLARAFGWQPKGQGFDSLILHRTKIDLV